MSSAESKRALEILERALADKVAVVRSHPSPVEQTEEITVRLERPPNPPLTVRLMAWRDGAEETGDVIWIVGKQDSRVIPRLRHRESSYVDLRGAVHLVLPWLLVDRTGVKPSFSPAQRARSNPFSDRNSLIVRVLLDDPGRRWGVRELASVAGVAPGTVSKVVRQLEADELVHTAGTVRSSVIRLSDPVRLLHRWIRIYDWTCNDSFVFHAPIGDLTRFLRRLPNTFGDTRWALTLQAGASLVAPHATWERVHAYVDVSDADEILALAGRAGWIAAPDGRVVLMRPYYRESVWYGSRNVDDLPVVSTVQLALDLWEYPLRGREQAEHLIDTFLRPGT